MKPFIHPRYRKLSSFSDHELSPKERRKVADHLARCPRCRHEIQFIRALDEAARSLPLPDATSDLLERILEGRASGDRVILPLADPEPRRRPRARILVAIIGAGVAVTTAAVLLSGGRAVADHSQLVFTPGSPGQGEAIDVRFESSMFADQPVLTLRARYRDADGDARYVEAAELVREDEGVYEGRFRLPDDVRYAAFAVEDPQATTVAHNDRRLWELLVHDDAGAAVPSALEQQIDDRAERSFRLALDGARAYVSAYPGRPEAWRRLFYYEQQIGAADTDSLIAAHFARFRALHQRFAGRADVSPDRMAALMSYAWDLDGAEERQFWLARLMAIAPGHEAAVTARLADALEGVTASPEALERIEVFWSAGAARSAQVARVGLHTALEIQDAGAIDRWSRRIAALPAADAARLASALSSYPAYREQALSIAKDALRRMNDAGRAERRLLHNRQQHERSISAARQELLLVLATVADAAGEPSLAADLTQRATIEGWNVGVFRRAAELELALGDTAAAVPFLARVSVDPLSSDAFTDSVRSRLGEQFDQTTWSALIRQASLMLTDWAMDTAINEPLRPDLRLRTADGETASLFDEGDQAPSDAAVLVYWDTQQLGLDGLRGVLFDLTGLVGGRIPIIAIVPQAPDSAVTASILPGTAQTRLLFDPAGVGRSRLGVLYAPEFIVVDQDSRIRFRGIAAVDAARFVTAFFRAAPGGSLVAED